MRNNVRQRDPGERQALLEVRHGDIDTALDWYLTNGRLRIDAEQLPMLDQVTDAWAADTAAGHDTVMLAWRRSTVAQLNRFARAKAEEMGLLAGEDLVAPGGRLYAQGDQVVTLAPNYRGDLVTSQRATVAAVDHQTQSLTIETDDGRITVLTGEEIDADHLDHGYAVTTHRAQGATADRAHFIAEGGGRELAYVALSRARHHTTVWTTADDHDQAIEQLTHDWTHTLAQDWVSLVHKPEPERSPGRSEPTAEPPMPHPHHDDAAAIIQRLDALERRPRPSPGHGLSM
jgi:ATP-dependent exoDNAse (exonuclease V) alpha subunit